MKRYERYKPSKVEWIGEIPEHWEVKKIRYILRDSIVDGPHETPEYTNIGIPFISVDSLGDSKNVNLENVTRYISETQFDEYNKKTQLKINDILFSKSATIGKVAIVDERKFMTWSPLAIIKCDEIKSFYLYVYYLLQMPRFIEYIKCNSTFNTQFNIGMKTLEKSMIPVPLIDEQKLIANYLDKKTVELEELIADKENLISLLEQEKELTISNVVTKGLNPDVTMKDSKVRWFDKTPLSWNETVLKRFATIYAGGTPSKAIPEYWQNGTIPWIASGEVNQEFIELPTTYITEEAFQNSSAKWIPRDSLVMALAGQGKTKGMVAYLNIDTTCNQSLCAIVPKDINPMYLFYFLKNSYKDIRKMVGDDSRDGLNLEIVSQIPILIPSSTEQEQIVEYLYKKIAETNEAVQIIKDEIELLKEYKETLIYEVITGKIDVRNIS